MLLEIPEEIMGIMKAPQVWDTEGGEEDEIEKWRDHKAFILSSCFAYISLGAGTGIVITGLVVKKGTRQKQDCQSHLLWLLSFHFPSN